MVSTRKQSQQKWSTHPKGILDSSKKISQKVEFFKFSQNCAHPSKEKVFSIFLKHIFAMFSTEFHRKYGVVSIINLSE